MKFAEFFTSSIEGGERKIQHISAS